MKNYLFTCALCVLCLPTPQQAMLKSIKEELPLICITNPTPRPSTDATTKKTKTKPLVTPEDFALVRHDVEKKWQPIEAKLKEISRRTEEERLALDAIPFIPIFSQPLETESFASSSSQKCSALHQDVDQYYKSQQLKRKESLKTASTNRSGLSSFEKYVFHCAYEDRVKTLPLLLSPEDATASMRELSTILDNDYHEHSAREQKKAFDDNNHDTLDIGATIVAATVGLAALGQNTVNRVHNAEDFEDGTSTRNPFALISAGLSLLNSSKKAIAATAGMAVVYLGIKSAINNFNHWLHSDCEEEKKNLADKFSKELNQFKEKVDTHEKKLKAEVLTIAEQARENALKSLVEYDKFEKFVRSNLKELDTAQKRTSSRLTESKDDQEKMRKQFFKELEKIRRHKDDEIKHKLGPLKKQLESMQETLKKLPKSDLDYAATIALVANELQRLGTTVDQLVPQHSRRPSLAPSDTGTYTSQAPSFSGIRPDSPTNSLYSSHSEVVVSRHRPFSAAYNEQRIEDSLKDILEEHLSSPENSQKSHESGHIVPPKKASMISSEQSTSFSQHLPSILIQQDIAPSLSQKTVSPRRRRSVCFGIFGKKEPKDTYDTRA